MSKCVKAMSVALNLIVAESLLFIGGALTALGIERLCWRISPGLFRESVKRLEARNRN